MIIGWIGLGLLLFSYCLLITEKYSKYFLIVDAVASLLLTVHAVMIKDLPFIIVNAFIMVILLVKIKQGGLK